MSVLLFMYFISYNENRCFTPQIKRMFLYIVWKYFFKLTER